MRTCISCLFALMLSPYAVALDFPEGVWKSVEHKVTDGVTRMVYNRSQSVDGCEIVFTVDVSETRTFRSYSQNILVMKDGAVCADVIISYSKNGTYVYQVRVSDNKGPVNYGRLGSAKDIDDLDREYVSVEMGSGADAKRLQFIRRGELFECMLENEDKSKF